MSTTETTAGEFRILPLERLHESPLNPRKRYDAAAMQDLAASIKAHGIITPLVVRPKPLSHELRLGTQNGHYEIGAGHRRYRAAKAAGLTEAPAVIRDMTDEAFLELLTIENLQREDLHPLEEADGYRALLDRAGYDVARIAERVGRSVKYVYDRVKLLALVKEARSLFLDGKLTAGHAILLARLSPKDQLRAIDPEERAAFEPEDTLWDPEQSDARRAARKEDPHAGMKPVSVRELQGWIDQHVRFDPVAADPVLFPEAVAVVGQAQEQEEKVIKITHEHYVQPEARDEKERTFGPQSWKRADGTLKSKRCEGAVTGVIVAGPGRGEAFKVCIDRKGCKTHWAAEQRVAKTRATSTARTGGTTQDRYAREQAKREAERAKADAESARWKKALPQLLEAVAAAVKKAPTKATGLLGSIICDSFELSWGHKDYSSAHVARGTTAEDLVRHCAFFILQGELQEYTAPADFPKRAKAFGLDVRKIVDEVAPKPAPAAKETPAKRKGKK